MNLLENSDTTRRLEAISELHLGLSDKCLRRGTAAAVSRVEQALEFAQKPTPVSVKLVDLIQYRLAHLLMRDAQYPHDFEHIDRKLAEIESPGDLPLGPAPLLLRTAVLHRWCLVEQDPARREQLRRQGADAFVAACKSVEALRRSGRSPHYRGTMTAFGPLHGALFNQLELACYFTGADYSFIDGLRADSQTDINLCEGLPERADWLVLGRGLGRDYRLPKSVALAEQLDLAVKTSTQLCLIVPHETAEEPTQIGIPPDFTFEQFERRQMRLSRLLALLAERESVSYEAIHRFVTGTEDPNNRDRVLSNLRSRLEKWTGVPRRETLIVDQGTVRLAPQIRLIVAAEGRVIEEPAPLPESRAVSRESDDSE